MYICFTWKTVLTSKTWLYSEFSIKVDSISLHIVSDKCSTAWERSRSSFILDFEVAICYFNSRTESHRMVRVGRDLWRSSPTPLPKQVHLDCTGPHPGGFWVSPERRMHSISGQPVPVLCHPQSEEVFPHVQLELPMLQFVPVAPCPVSGHHWKESGPILSTPTLKIFISICKIPSQPSPG